MVPGGTRRRRVERRLDPSAEAGSTPAYHRIRSELATLGIVIAPSSVRTILKRRYIDLSPHRSRPTWAELLGAQAKGLVEGTLTADPLAMPAVAGLGR